MAGAQGLQPWTRRLTAGQLRFAPPRISRSTRPRTRLLQRVRAGESVDRGERISDPGEIQKRRGVDREEFCSCGLAREADVGERDRVAVAIAAGSGSFRCASSAMSAAVCQCWHHLMRVGSSSLNSCSRYSRTRGTISGCESQATIFARPRTRARPRASRGSSGGFGCVSSRYSMTPALEQDRSFAVDQSGKRHHRIDCAVRRFALRALYEVHVHHLADEIRIEHTRRVFGE